MVRNSRMNSKGLFSSAVLLILVPAALSNLGAAERKQGAVLSIQKTDGTVIKGELLSVGGRDLILMEAALNGVTVNIDDVKRLTIENRSKFFQGVGIGLLSGGAVGGAAGFLSGDDPPGFFSFSAGDKALIFGLFFGAIGTVIGGVSGALAGIDEYITIPSGSEDLKLKILAKLAAVSRSGAMIAELSPNAGDPEMIKPEKAAVQRGEEEARALTGRKITELPGQDPVKAGGASKFSRIHLTVESGYAVSPIGDGFIKTMDEWGFGSDYSSTDWLGSYTRSYPSVSGRKLKLFRKVQLEYSIMPAISIGIAYCSLSKCDLQGFHHVKSYTDSRGTSLTGIGLNGEFQGGAYYLLASFWPIPNGFTRKSTGKLSAGIGLADMKQTFRSDDTVVMKKRPLSLIVDAEYDYFLSRNVSLGLDIDYQYVPLRIDGFSLTGHYHDTAWWSYGKTTVPVRVDSNFPGAKLNVGGFTAGLNLGFHF